MKNSLIIFLVLLVSTPVLCQVKKDSVLLKTEHSWKSEIFNFPIPFAKTLDYKGMADVRFPKGWGDQNSPEFWSYVFAWQLDGDPKLTEEKLQNDLQVYFDGLMKVVAKSRGKEELAIENTLALFLKKPDTNNISGFIGRVRIFDVFFTDQSIVLNVTIESFYCKENNKYMVLFNLSAQAFESNVWGTLKGAKLINGCTTK